MTFPTEADIGFFTSEEAKRIQEGWEPKEGDWVKTRYDGIQVLKTDDDSRYLVWHIGRTYPDLEEVTYLSGGYAEAIKEECVWLPRPDQLWEMLEERGRFLMFNGSYMMPERRYQVTAMAEDLDRLDARIDAFGPTPSIALGRALIEVMGREDELSVAKSLD